MRRFWKYISAERLAITVFLAVAFSLWWCMQSRPERVMTYGTERCRSNCQISPNGTLCLVHEWRNFSVYGQKTDPWQHRLRVFDLATGHEVWHWDSGQESIRHVTWTGRNHLYFFVAKYEVPKGGGLL